MNLSHIEQLSYSAYKVFDTVRGSADSGKFSVTFNPDGLSDLDIILIFKALSVYGYDSYIDWFTDEIIVEPYRKKNHFLS